MPYLKDILLQVQWRDVQTILEELYDLPQEYTHRLQDFYHHLKTLPVQSVDSCQIQVHQINNRVEVIGLEWVPDEKTGDVHQQPVSLALTPWSEWLGMSITKDTLRQFSPPEIAAHALMEMTRWGFSEDTKAALWEKAVEAQKHFISNSLVLRNS